MKIRKIHIITLGIIFAFRIFYSLSIDNMFKNINNLFDYKIPEIRYITYFFLILSIFISMFLRDKRIINQVFFWILTILNIFIMILSIKVW